MGLTVEIDAGAVKPLDPPPRLLMGPGPCNAHPRVHAAMALPQVGHLDPAFLGIMEEIKTMMRYAWQTQNAFTVPVSGTGSAAMEACVCNMVEPGDKVLVAVNGYFGLRLVEMAKRYGAEVVTVTKPWGQVFSLAEIKAALAEHSPAVFAIVHAETSTGALQPLDGVGDACHAAGAILLADTVTSLAGVPLHLDAWGVDAAYSGGQKCLSCPPGASPLTFSPRAMDRLRNRKVGVKNWYLDQNLIAQYLVQSGSAPRAYHHTAPISMMYALHESLRLVVDEGLEARWQRHADVAQKLYDELAKLDIFPLVDAAIRLPQLTTAVIPKGIDGKAVQVFLLKNYNIEIGGGLGELAGKVWRIGLMGHNARAENVVTFIGALKDALRAQGYGPAGQ